MFFREFDLPKAPTFPPLSVSVTDFGAREGECVSCAIAEAIDYVFSHGGGRVVIPSGEWKCGPIHLKSNIDLHLEEGAVLSFSTLREDYLPLVLINYEGIRCYNYSPMIYANGEENIAITPGFIHTGNTVCCQIGTQAHFPEKPFETGLVQSQIRMQNLQGNQTIHGDLTGKIHRTHAPDSQHLPQLIIPYPFPRWFKYNSAPGIIHWL